MLSKRKNNKIKLFNNKKNLRLDKFIDLALYERNGYYLSKKPIGRKFDFVTSPEISQMFGEIIGVYLLCLLYTSPSPRDSRRSRMPSSA